MLVTAWSSPYQTARISIEGAWVIAKLSKIRPWSIATLVAIVSLSGCSTVEQLSELDAPAESTSPIDSPAVVVAAPQEIAPEPVRIAILLSADIGTYEGIADQIVQRGANSHYEIFSLEGGNAKSELITAEMEKFSPDKIVAIGLSAAKWSRQFASKSMVFCQVFNYQDHDLLSNGSKGVKLLPPFKLQLKRGRRNRQTSRPSV